MTVRDIKALGKKVFRANYWNCVIAAVLLAVVLNVNHISGYDFGYYIGIPNGSVFRNTMEHVDAFTGEIPNSQREFYLLNTNLLHTAVMFQALNLTPLVEAELTLSVVVPLLFVMVLFMTGKMLFADDAQHAGMFTLLVLAVLIFSFGISGSSMYFVYRPFEGKGLMSFLMPAAVFCAFCALYRRQERFGHALLFFTGACGIAFSNSAVFVIPGMTALLGLPYVIAGKSWIRVRNLCLAALPSVLWACAFVLLGR